MGVWLQLCFIGLKSDHDFLPGSHFFSTCAERASPAANWINSPLESKVSGFPRMIHEKNYKVQDNSLVAYNSYKIEEKLSERSY